MANETLRDTIKAAMEAEQASRGGDAGGAEQAAAAAGDDAAQAGAEAAAGGEEGQATPPAATGEEDASGEGQDGRERDGKGRFAKTGKDAHNQASEAAPSADATPPDEETSRAPPGLAAPLRAEWANLDPKWREAFWRQEKSFKIVRDEWQPKAEQLHRFEEVVAPHRQRLALSGVDEVTWIRNLAAAEQALIENPAAGIAYLARTYGADPRQVFAHLNGQAGPTGPAADPVLAPILNELQTLKDTVSQQTRSAEQARMAEVRGHIEAFANDPKHLYWEDVKEDVAALLAQGRATDLGDAYDKACWANPEIRGLLLKEQQAEQARATEQAQAKAKARAAAQAAGSVTGAPGAGGASALGVDPKNLRGLIEAAVAEHAGRV